MASHIGGAGRGGSRAREQPHLRCTRATPPPATRTIQSRSTPPHSRVLLTRNAHSVDQSLPVDSPFRPPAPICLSMSCATALCESEWKRSCRPPAVSPQSCLSILLSRHTVLSFSSSPAQSLKLISTHCCAAPVNTQSMRVYIYEVYSSEFYPPLCCLANSNHLCCCAVDHLILKFLQVLDSTREAPRHSTHTVVAVWHIRTQAGV